MSNTSTEGAPSIVLSKSGPTGTEYEVVKVTRAKGLAFGAYAKTREEALFNLVLLMAGAMDAHAEATGEDPAKAIAPVTSAQIEELRRMGREEGCLSLPAHGAARLDLAELTPAQWALNWRVWKDLAFFPWGRFVGPGFDATFGGKEEP